MLPLRQFSAYCHAKMVAGNGLGEVGVTRLLQNVTDAPAVFVVRQDIPEDWTVDSDPSPVTMEGMTAVFRVLAEPGQIVRLHVGIRNTVPMAENAR
jgi:hypothetical protein